MTANTTGVFSLGFWRASAERAIAAAAVGALSLWTSDLMGVHEVDPALFGSLAVGAAVFSVLKDIAATKTVGTPSLVRAEVLTSDVVERVAKRNVEGRESTVVVSGPANDLASYEGDVIRPVGTETPEAKAVRQVREGATDAWSDMHDRRNEDLPPY